MAHVAGLPWQFHPLAKYPPLELPARARDRLRALTLWQAFFSLLSEPGTGFRTVNSILQQYLGDAAHNVTE